MKNKQSIAHYTGREQQALLRLKNKIAELYKPLIIYLIGCKSSYDVTRTCFANPRNDDQWNFSCDLLLVLPEGIVLPDNAPEELKSLNQEYEAIRLSGYPFDFVKKQLKQSSLFFCWMQRRAIVLYERDNTSQKLPEAVQNMKQYEKQVHELFANNPDYENYTEIKLSPLPQNRDSKKERGEFFDAPKLSAKLLERLAEFLQYHDPGSTGFRLRRALIEYVSSVSEIGAPRDFKDTLWDFEDLMEFFDLAAEELKNKPGGRAI